MSTPPPNPGDGASARRGDGTCLDGGAHSVQAAHSRRRSGTRGPPSLAAATRARRAWTAAPHGGQGSPGKGTCGDASGISSPQAPTLAHRTAAHVLAAADRIEWTSRGCPVPVQRRPRHLVADPGVSTCASYGDGRGIGRHTRSLERCTRIDGCDASSNSAHTAPRAHMALRVDSSCHEDNAHSAQAVHPPSAPRRLWPSVAGGGNTRESGADGSHPKGSRARLPGHLWRWQ